MTPMLVTACTALPPEGACAPWGGPAARDMTPTLVIPSTSPPPGGAPMPGGGPATRA